MLLPLRAILFDLDGKPHAMPMLHAAKLAGVAADECVYVGDAERDIQAAHAAGMPGLVTPYGYLQPDEDWRAWGGDGVIQSPLDLLPWLEHSGRL
jgi:phosphoglycolate phosphatase